MFLAWFSGLFSDSKRLLEGCWWVGFGVGLGVVLGWFRIALEIVLKVG